MEDKLNAVYALSLHQFDKMTSQMSDLFDEHIRKVIQCRKLKSKAKSLKGERDILSLRCSKMKCLISETLDEHDETKAKLRKQLALGKDRIWEIQDLKELADKNEALVNVKRDFKKERGDRVEKKKLNADVVMNLQKELNGYKKELTKEREKCKDLQERNEVILKEKSGAW